MVGIVIVSHSEHLASSVIELTRAMAPKALTASAGGLEDGSFGTSFQRIQSSIESIYSEDGVLVLVDMGSAVMTTQMVLESMPEKKVEIVDCPLVEGAVVATLDAEIGIGFEEIKKDLSEVASTPKL